LISNANLLPTMQAASEELRQRISSVRRESFDGHSFYCPAEVREALTLDAVTGYLQHLPALQDNPLDVGLFATLILNSATLILATLLADGNGPDVLGFVHRQFTDEQMHFDAATIKFLPELVRDQFLQRQREFRPVILTTNGVHQTIDDKWILPFLAKTELGNGSFGSVSKVRIPARCQDLVVCSNKEVEIALKVLKGGESGELERATLSWVRTLKHPNIIGFLGSFTHRNEFSLLFPAATMNLRKFLLSTPPDRPPLSTPSLYANIYGLADALARIHNFAFRDHGLDITRIGYHHDLRPENILIHHGRFVISDFGLSRLKPEEKDSKTPLKGGHEDYLGPESFDYQELVNGSVGRALDVWAFGCILAELATLITGQSVAAFRDTRKATHESQLAVTDCAFHLNGQVRPAVTRWLDFICRDAHHPLPNLVQVAREMLNPDPRTRPNIAHITPKLLLLAMEAALAGIDGQLSASPSDPDGDAALTSETDVFVLLEQKRIQAWHGMFSVLDQEVKLKHAPKALAALEHLGKLVPVTDMPSCAPATLPREILDAVDAVCGVLPEDAYDRFRHAWVQSVCEINDIKILEAIRSTTKLDRYRSVGISAAMKHMSSMISRAIRYGGSRIVDMGSVTVGDDRTTHVSPTDKSKTMGSFTDDCLVQHRVLIEWKDYDINWKDRAHDLRAIMDGLVNLLDDKVTPRPGRAAVRIPRCLGYFHEQLQHRFGFLYSLPAHLSGQDDAHLFSLHRIISLTTEARTDGKVEPPRPDLGDVFDLAKDLASCIMTVHEAGWLHKNITSHQVLVFSSAGNWGVHRHVASSAVLSGFNDSRPEVASSATLGPSESSWLYRHEAYRHGVPFRRSFDYYGLGLVLLELGMWLTVSELKAVDYQDMETQEFRQVLLTDYVPQLGENVGARYRNAVRFCLDAEEIAKEAGIDVENGGAMHALFTENVVSALAPCCA
jgi:serine/threonine protein kinase